LLIMSSCYTTMRVGAVRKHINVLVHTNSSQFGSAISNAEEKASNPIQLGTEEGIHMARASGLSAVAGLGVSGGVLATGA